MVFLSKHLGQAALVVASLLAGTTQAAGGPGPASSQSDCTIYYSTQPVSSVHTGHHTVKTTRTPTVVIHSTSTVTRTPRATTTTTTVTETDTSTSTVPSTSTFTSTVTSSTTVTTSASTVTLTVTTTTTTTTTSTTTTSVGTTNGFVPIQSSVPDSSYDGAEGGPASKRSLTDDSFDELYRNIERAAGQHILHHHKYPQSVECTKTRTKYAPTTTITRTSKPDTTTAPAPVRTSTITTTTTTTTTTASEADTTVTTTTTETSTSTVTPTTTTTSTQTVTAAAVATATVYEECQYINFADKRKGVHGVGVSGNAQREVQFPNIHNALDCCNQCAATANCDFTLYTAQSGGCYSFSGSDFNLYQAASLDWVVNNGVYAVGPAS